MCVLPHIYAHTQSRIRLFFRPNTTSRMNAPTYPTIYLHIHTHTHTHTNAYTVTGLSLCPYNHPSTHFNTSTFTTSANTQTQTQTHGRSSTKLYLPNSKGNCRLCACVCVQGSLDFCSSIKRIYSHQHTCPCSFLYAAVRRKRSNALRKNSECRQHILGGVRVCTVAGNSASSCLSAWISAAPTGRIYGTI